MLCNLKKTTKVKKEEITWEFYIVSSVSQQIKLFFRNLMEVTCAWILPSSVTTQCVAVHTTFRWTIASREDINSTTLVAMLKVSWILMTNKCIVTCPSLGGAWKLGRFDIYLVTFSIISLLSIWDIRLSCCINLFFFYSLFIYFYWI